MKMISLTKRTNLNSMACAVHVANKKWWQDIDTGRPIKRNKWELLALAITEVSEAVEGERKKLMDDKLPHRLMAEVEMADTYIRLLDFAAGFGFVLYRYKLVDSVPLNRGEALFRIMHLIAHCESANTSTFLCLALANIEAYCDYHGYDLRGAINEKMAFNATREDHKHEARRIAGGKQF